MITVKRLIEILRTYPPGCAVRAYEGEDCGLVIEAPDGRSAWIRARDTESEDEQIETEMEDEKAG